MKQFKIIIITFASILALCFAACGSDSGPAQAETVYGLGECEESNDGVIKLVTSEDQYYKCVDGDWEETEAPLQSKSGYNPVNQTLTDSRDGQTYRTVKIGDQVWMAENLNYRYLGPTAEWDSSSFCHDDKLANCTKYGRLYLWSAAMDSAGIIKGNTANGCGDGLICSPSEPVRGVCPSGWHLPTEGEWIRLLTAVGGEGGEKLKSTRFWRDYDGKSGNGTDSFGFSVLPVGGRGSDGKYGDNGFSASFWTSDDCYGKEMACDMDFAYYYDGANNCEYAYKSSGLSVRCLMD